jgi:hypothetical protein
MLHLFGAAQHPLVLRSTYRVRCASVIQDQYQSYAGGELQNFRLLFTVVSLQSHYAQEASALERPRALPSRDLASLHEDSRVTHQLATA